jgi:hypothetical protein
VTHNHEIGEETTVKNLATLKKVNLRTVWPREAVDFTPWLAQNLSALGVVLGMDLELQTQEAPVGDFSLDLLVHDLSNDRQVVIENQFSRTDHDHLGKLLTYAAGYDAHVVVWIAEEIREEHRQALDWLNQHTDTTIQFYAVVVEVLQIDDSRPAYNFKLVAFPNEWRKGKVKPPALTGRGEAYRAYFQSLIDQLREQYRFTNARVGQAQSWYTFATGVTRLTGIVYGASFAAGGRARVELYIDRPDASLNKAIFDTLRKDEAAIESAVGDQLVWERLDERRASRIAVYRPGSITDSPQTLDELRSWTVDRLLRFKAVFGPRLEALSRSGVNQQEPPLGHTEMQELDQLPNRAEGSEELNP